MISVAPLLVFECTYNCQIDKVGVNAAPMIAGFTKASNDNASEAEVVSDPIGALKIITSLRKPISCSV